MPRSHLPEDLQSLACPVVRAAQRKEPVAPNAALPLEHDPAHDFVTDQPARSAFTKRRLLTIVYFIET